MNKYIIYGTGDIAKEYFEKIKKEHGADSVECFIDSMLSKESFCDKKVITPAELKQKDFNAYTYILGTMTNKKSMINELQQQGIKYENILIERDYGSNSFEDNVKCISKILLYPATDDEAFLTHVDEQFSILVPNMKNLKEKPKIVSNKIIELKNINMISNMTDIEEYDLILVWKKENLADERLHTIKNVYCIDPSYFSIIDTRILLRLNFVLESNENKRTYIEASKQIYKQFAQKHVDSNSFVFGTGPSCRKGSDMVFDRNSVRIACNTLIDSETLMIKIHPNIYVISDESLMGKVGLKLTKKICNYVLDNKCILIVPDILGAVLINRYPNLLNKIVRISFDTNKKNFPSPENMSVLRKAYNVITLLSIPVASYFTDKIYISGCDGVNPKNCIIDNKIWEYEQELEENDSIDFVAEIKEHNWEKEYYQKHLSYFEELLEFGEQLGKTYISYTESYIPALQKRSL